MHSPPTPIGHSTHKLHASNTTTARDLYSKDGLFIAVCSTSHDCIADSLLKIIEEPIKVKSHSGRTSCPGEFRRSEPCCRTTTRYSIDHLFLAADLTSTNLGQSPSSSVSNERFATTTLLSGRPA